MIQNCYVMQVRSLLRFSRFWSALAWLDVVSRPTSLGLWTTTRPSIPVCTNWTQIRARGGSSRAVQEADCSLVVCWLSETKAVSGPVVSSAVAGRRTQHLQILLDPNLSTRRSLKPQLRSLIKPPARPHRRLLHISVLSPSPFWHYRHSITRLSR